MSKICPNCQNEVPESATFCPYCNEALSKPKIVEERKEYEEDFREHPPYHTICPACEFGVIVKNHHCPNCGHYFNSNKLNFVPELNPNDPYQAVTLAKVRLRYRIIKAIWPLYLLIGFISLFIAIVLIVCKIVDENFEYDMALVYSCIVAFVFILSGIIFWGIATSDKPSKKSKMKQEQNKNNE